MSDAVAMSFKARMNKLSKECGLRPQSVIQNYMFERFLQRLAESPFRENFVIKGGVLISAMVGIRVKPSLLRSVRRFCEGMLSARVQETTMTFTF